MVLREIGSQRLDVLSYVTSVAKEAAQDRKTVRVCYLLITVLGDLLKIPISLTIQVT